MQEEMEALRKQAYLAQVVYERKQEAQQRKKNEEEARRRKEEARIRRALLEAAFDDELEEVVKLLQQGAEFGQGVVRALAQRLLVLVCTGKPFVWIRPGRKRT
jgi:hypothetical protein